MGQGMHCISNGLYVFLLERKLKLGTGFFVHQKTVLAVKSVESVSDRIPYTVLRGLWLNIILLLNAHEPTEEKRDFSRDNFL